ncbi:signal peptidase II [Saxibacter everestensis]|uniref:Lipoprotein signal peptidase n=1 Tax=Saxibacter everestensis TaxID=2909229 RepID=A0ABY8QY59_9MICO|nr:signal peptidase II [Brevibacteriaceae bacterium ZFBP1038]
MEKYSGEDSAAERRHEEANRSPGTPGPGRRASRARLLAALSAVVVAVVLVDQLTKALAIATLEGNEPVPIIGPYVSFHFYRNAGAAFGMGSQATWVFPLIGLVVLGIVAFLARKLGSRAWAAAFGLLLGGLLGNFIDRMVQPPSIGQGAVVDFINLHFFICNVADIAITAAAALIIILSFRGIGVDGTLTEDAPKEKSA